MGGTTKRARAHETSSGTAAEYFVAAELIRRGGSAFLTIGNHKQVDILVRTNAGIVRTVDVKAVHGKKPREGRKTHVSWNMPKVESRRESKDFFYVLTWLGNKRGHYASPEYFIVTAKWAGELCKKSFAEYLAASPTRDPASAMRRIHYTEAEPWRDRWDLLLE
jgi:hypothetical protein